VLQYNYAHDNWGAGLGVYIDGEWKRNTIRYNVAINNGTSPSASYFGNIVIANGADAPDLQIYNNTMISDGPENTNAGISIQGNPRGALMANNLIVSLNGANYYNTGAEKPEIKILSNNYYARKQVAVRWMGQNYSSLDEWRSATGSETLNGKSLAHTFDPKLALEEIGKICQGYKRACPDIALKISPDLFRAGIDLRKPPYEIDVGKQDYAGYKIPNDAGFSIGAFGGVSQH
jgi:hypothetical protein